MDTDLTLTNIVAFPMRPDAVSLDPIALLPSRGRFEVHHNKTYP